MDAVNLCKLLPGPGCRCVPGGDSQRETAAARDHAARGKAPACWTRCCVRAGTKQHLRELLKMKFYGLCCASGVSESQGLRWKAGDADRYGKEKTDTQSTVRQGQDYNLWVSLLVGTAHKNKLSASS